ncbi:GH36-type glycosyl hydrolase domain-containing protein [Haploplasma axanthum]|nr:hypothetical protein [Haploplasma axanthum]
MINNKKIRLNKNNGYYLPLFNMNGTVSSITPFFAGDLKKSYYNYALEPISELGMYNLTRQRNIIFFVNSKRFDLNGQLEHQQDDEVFYEVNQLSQIVTRSNSLFEIKTKSFIPVNDDVEVHHIKYKNKTNETQKLKAITSIPLYGRSPENIHDHRHVTSLLNVCEIVENGIINKPTLSFDERGHKSNNNYYSVFCFSDSMKVKNYIPVLDDYINGGSFLLPRGLDNDKYHVKDIVKGYEIIGAIAFEEVEVKANEEIVLVLTIGISENLDQIEKIKKYQDIAYLEEKYNETIKFFDKLNSYITFEFDNEERIEQVKWITLQPILRRFLGNSYLPHHDYGHGGRGWRDLWQDLLALIYSGDKTVKESIISNFAGVRIDGSNATIIGDKLGEFKADRNQIVRVWSDHGAWPLLTTKMYIDETGDTEILFIKQKYFDDKFTHYTKKTKETISDNNVMTYMNKVYYGTIFEHILLENLIGYLNIGKHGFTRLEDADWNDGLDMANKEGETVPFTMFYLNNLRVIVDILKNIKVDKLELFEGLIELLDGKIKLDEYFNLVSNYEKIDKVEIKKEVIIKRLNELIKIKESFISKHATVNNNFYQSYVNNDGKFLDDEKSMSLTAQTMGLINNIPSKDFALEVALNTKKLLFDKKIGGYRLNTDYKEVMLNMGRAYGFAYGHKENGAVFSHMATMYAYGLYNYSLVDYGHEAIATLLNRALDKDSGVLVGVPEYFNDRGVGKYMYLTGTASWIIKLLREQMFGIKLNYGILSFDPKLEANNFINGRASLETYIFNKKCKIIYLNEKNLSYGKYKIKQIKVNGQETIERAFNSISGTVEVILDEIN